MVDIEQSKILDRKISKTSSIQWIENISRIKMALVLFFTILIVAGCLWPSPFIPKGTFLAYCLLDRQLERNNAPLFSKGVCF
jgi:hypothetical protein